MLPTLKQKSAGYLSATGAHLQPIRNQIPKNARYALVLLG
jgi:hypothetical protein